MAIEIRWQESGYIKIYSGVVTGTDLYDSIRSHAQDARFKQTRYALNHFLPNCALSFTAEEVAKLEFLEAQFQYASRKIVLGYVTEDERVIATLKKVFLVSPMIIYPDLVTAQLGISHLLRIQSDDAQAQVHLNHYYAPPGGISPHA